MNSPLKVGFPGPATSAAQAAALNRRFGFTVGGVLLIAAAYAHLRHHTWPWGLLLSGGLLCAAASLLPAKLTPLRRGWERLGFALGQANTYVLLTVVYGVVCVPLGWLQRWRGRDPLHRQWRPAAATYWRSPSPRGPWPLQF